MFLTESTAALRAVAVSMLVLFTCSCVNDEYDLDNIDSTVDIQGTINLPLGSTEFIPIGDFFGLDPEDGQTSVLSTDANGNYSISVDGDQIAGSVEIPAIVISTEDPVQDGGFRAFLDVRSELESMVPGISPDDPILSGMEIESVSTEPAATDIVINEDISDVTDIVKAIRYLSLDAPVELVFSLKNGNGSSLKSGSVTIKGGFSIVFPDFIVLEKRYGDFEIYGNRLVFPDDVTVGTEPLSLGFAISAIDFNEAEGQGLVGNTIRVSDEIELSSMDISLDPTEFGDVFGDLPETVSIDIDINVTEMKVNGIEAVIEPETVIEDQTFEIGELPDFLSGDNVNLDLYNPVLNLDITARQDETPDENFPAFVLNAGLESYKNGNSVPGFPVTLGEGLDIRKGTNHFVISRIPVDISGEDPSLYLEYWDNVVVDSLGYLIKAIPDYIQIKDIDITVRHTGNAPDGYADSDYTAVVFPEDGSPLVYDINMSYALNIPLAFGPDLDIACSTEFDGWNSTFSGDGDSDYTLDLTEAEIRFDFVNTIPLTLDVTADAIGLDGNVLSDIGVELSGNIAAGNIGNGTSTPLSITIKATRQALDRFDGLRLNIKAASAENPELQGVALNEKQGIKLERISASIQGGVQFDLKGKEGK